MQIILKAINKVYNQGQPNQVQALTDIDLTIPSGSMVLLRGPSGSGKTTLLSIIGCVFQPTSGTAIIGDKQITRLPDRFLTLQRQKTIGFIFQHFNLLPELSVLANVTLPLLPLGIAPKQRRIAASDMLDKLGIAHRINFPASQVSGGELQRVAIARALINEPSIILADEPTAHLDNHRSLEFLEIMIGLKKEGKTIVLTSHDPLVSQCRGVDHSYDIRDGRIAEPR